MNKPERVALHNIVEVLQAMHLSYAVHSVFPQRSGALLVAPAGHVKTTLLTILRDYFPNYLLVSDLNSNQLSSMREDLFGGRYQTVAFADMIKLYERNPSVAANLEGTLRAMVDEGWAGATSKDHGVASAPVRVHIMGGMTPNMYERKFRHWKETGFARRFLWIHFKLENPAIIGDAIEAQQKIIISCNGFPLSAPQIGSIKVDIEPRHMRELRNMIVKQPGYDSTPYTLLVKAASVLKWKYAKEKAPSDQYMKTMREFAKTLQHEYAEAYI